ncbi:hypothetical protein B0H13DRAFT_1864362 [Mycena leptocephala]|nr:hypothetical protein B0H13DRAFT_1864362 [Mycena leptocephala]
MDGNVPRKWLCGGNSESCAAEIVRWRKWVRNCAAEMQFPGWSSRNSRPISAAPSSVYGDPSADRPVIPSQFFVSCSFFSASPPSVSVEIGPWDGANWAAADSLYVEPGVRQVDEAPDIDAPWMGLEAVECQAVGSRRVFGSRRVSAGNQAH